MTKLNEIRFFLFASLMILPTLALELHLANDKGDFRIHATAISGEKLTLIDSTSDKYRTDSYTKRVILYIVSPGRLNEIMNSRLDDARMEISNELEKVEPKVELFYLGIGGFEENKDETAIRHLILDRIRRGNFVPLHSYKFETIGKINLTCKGTFPEFSEYEENYQFFDGNLQERLEAMQL